MIPMDFGSPKETVTAKINNKIMVVDFVSSDKNAYDDVRIKLQYLGTGVYHKIGNSVSNDKKLYHFWKKRNMTQKEIDQRDEIFRTVKDLVGSFLWYERKDDEDLPRGVIEKAVKSGTISVEEIIQEFERSLREHL